MASTRTAFKSSKGADRQLIVNRTLDAPRALVFRAWTDPAHLARWWGPEGFTVPECKMDVRIGGAWRTCMRSPDGNEYRVRGVYREIVKPERLVFTWAWEDESGQTGHETIVTVTFAERAGKTAMRLVHGLFESKKARDSHKWGWSSALVCLRDYVSKKGRK